jgi:hypothetical protein
VFYEEFVVLDERAMIRVGIQDQLGIRQLLLQRVRVYGWRDNVVVAVDDQRRLVNNP